MTPSEQYVLARQQATVDKILQVLTDVRCINKEENSYKIPINFIQQTLGNAQTDLINMKAEFGVKL